MCQAGEPTMNYLFEDDIFEAFANSTKHLTLNKLQKLNLQVHLP